MIISSINIADKIIIALWLTFLQGKTVLFVVNMAITCYNIKYCGGRAMFYIRADGNSDIGMGHVMRCLSIAEAACDYNGGNIKPVFITADEGCKAMIGDRGFESIVLGTDYKDMESELPRLLDILDKSDVILVDSYQVTVNYYRELGKLCKVACLEDMGEPYPVDVLINYNIYAPSLKEKYVKSDISPRKIYLGLEYMPLRTAFRTGLDYNVREKITNVMLTTGGSDPMYASGAILEKIVSIPDITIHAVSGPFNKNADRLKAEYGNYRNVVIHENVKDMKALMKKCDVIITATGSTIYEVSALGVPMICFYFAENQRQGAEEISRLTDIVNAGCFGDDIKGTVDNIYNTLLRCAYDYNYRMTIHSQEKKLIDANGAMRIVEKLLQ
jgi:UDP-2,4-diacetamido-2,4,6-trideoxy-beta-L-altropyranose hydrolase